MAKFSLSDALKKLTGSAKTAAADIERQAEAAAKQAGKFAGEFADQAEKELSRYAPKPPAQPTSPLPNEPQGGPASMQGPTGAQPTGQQTTGGTMTWPELVALEIQKREDKAVRQHRRTARSRSAKPSGC